MSFESSIFFVQTKKDKESHNDHEWTLNPKDLESSDIWITVGLQVTTTKMERQNISTTKPWLALTKSLASSMWKASWWLCDKCLKALHQKFVDFAVDFLALSAKMCQRMVPLVYPGLELGSPKTSAWACWSSLDNCDLQQSESKPP